MRGKTLANEPHLPQSWMWSLWWMLQDVYISVLPAGAVYLLKVVSKPYCATNERTVCPPNAHWSVQTNYNSSFARVAGHFPHT